MHRQSGPRRRPVQRAAALALLLLFAGSGAGAQDRAASGKALTGLVKKRLGRVNLHEVKPFYGDFTGDGRDDALVFAYYDDRSGGNAINLDVMLFEGRPGGFAFLRKVEDVFGQDPRAAQFSRGRIRITLTTLGPNDPRCCPTLPKQYTITAP